MWRGINTLLFKLELLLVLVQRCVSSVHLDSCEFLNQSITTHTPSLDWLSILYYPWELHNYPVLSCSLLLVVRVVCGFLCWRIWVLFFCLVTIIRGRSSFGWSYSPFSTLRHVFFMRRTWNSVPWWISWVKRNCELSVRNMSAKKKDLLSSAMKRTSEWFFILFIRLFCFSIYFSFQFWSRNRFSFAVIKHKKIHSLLHRFRISSQEVSSDVTVHVGEASFSLHKVDSRSIFSDQSLWC